MTTVAAVLVVLVVLSVLIHRAPALMYLPLCLISTAGLLIWGRLIGLTWSDLGLGIGTWVSGLLWGAMGAALVGAVVAGAVALPRTRRLFVDAKSADHGSARVAYEVGVRLPWGTVLLEETAFRGLPLVVLLAQSGRGTAIVVSAIAFGLWHVVPSLGRGGQLNAAGKVLGRHVELGFVTTALLTTSVAGAALAAIRLASDSLLASMAVHWMLNAAAMLATATAMRITGSVADKP